MSSPTIEPAKFTLEQWANEAKSIEAACRSAFNRGARTFQDLCAQTELPSILIPPHPLNSYTLTAFFTTFAQVYISYKKSQLAKSLASPKHEISKVPGRKYGKYTLFPDQQGVVDALLHDLVITRSRRAAINDGKMGVGKTPAAGAFIIEFLKHLNSNPTFDPLYSFRMHKVIILTPKNVVDQYKEDLINMGLEAYLKNRSILVINSDQFKTDFGDMYLEEVLNVYTDPPTTELKWRNKVLLPSLLIIDECHQYINPDAAKTKLVLAMLEAAPTMPVIFFSGTPWEKTQDAYVYLLAAGKAGDIPIVDKKSFRSFALSIDPNPDKPNEAAGARLRAILDSDFYSFPYVKWPYKNICATVITNFANDKDRNAYESYYARYLENLAKLGKNTDHGRHAARVATLQFCKAAEPLRAHYIVDQIMNGYKSGTYRSACGFSYKASIVKVAFMLSELGVTRDQMTIIWGGNTRIDQSLVLPSDELNALLSDPDFFAKPCEPSLMKRIMTTLKFAEDQVFNNETPEQQKYRLTRMDELLLTHAQSNTRRQYEISQWKKAIAPICLFTAAAGGTGLSLNHWNVKDIPVRGFHSPIYSGKVAAQLLGRIPRRNSVSDTYQWIVMMGGTVEETSVAPVLDQKMRNIAAITKRGDEYFDLLAQSKINKAKAKLRTIQEAVVDAENDTTTIDDDGQDDD